MYQIEDYFYLYYCFTYCTDLRHGFYKIVVRRTPLNFNVNNEHHAWRTSRHTVAYMDANVPK